MRYFVISQSGRFGPADSTLLSQWAEEGRLTAATVLEEEGTGRRIAAETVVGSVFTPFQQPPSPTPIVPPPAPGVYTAPSAPPPPGLVSNYRRPNDQAPLFLASEIDGRKELTYSFIFAVAGPLVAFVRPYGIGMVIAGIYCGVLAMKRGRKLGALGIALNVLALVAALAFHFWRYWD